MPTHTWGMASIGSAAISPCSRAMLISITRMPLFQNTLKNSRKASSQLRQGSSRCRFGPSCTTQRHDAGIG